MSPRISTSFLTLCAIHKMKEVKRTNTFFLILVILHITASLVVSMLDKQAVKLGTFSSLMLTQLLILVPSFLFFLISGYDIAEWIPFKKLKAGTVALVIVFTFLIMPLISFVNVFSQLFTDNTAVDLIGEVADMSPFITVLIVGFIGPFCEEFTFRGVIYGGLRKSGSLCAAAAVTGVFFGLMHLNLNQLSYALILGFVMALLVEATGSIWASVTAHVTVNAWNVIMMLAMDKLYSSMGIDIFKESQEAATTDLKLNMMGMLIIVSVFTTLLAAGAFIGLSSHEGRIDHVKTIFKSGSCDTDSREEEKKHVITVSGYLAAGLCVFVIFFLDKVLGNIVK